MNIIKINYQFNRMCSQTELSNTVTFLCSDLSSYLPGVIIKQDGVGN